VSARGRGRLLSGSTAVVLLVVGCGQSSKGKSTRSTAGRSVPQATVGSSTPQPPAPSTPAAGATVRSSSRGVTALLHAGTHHPKVDRPWPLRLTVTRGGHAARASLSYEYLFNGQVVAHRSHFTFTGHFSDIFRWPSSAVGYPLTFRAVIVSGAARIDLDYPVQVTA
jgi:hypothetical protein